MKRKTRRFEDFVIKKVFDLIGLAKKEAIQQKKNFFTRKRDDK